MARRGLRRSPDERRVGYLLALFFAVLAVPAGVLIFEAYGQLEWEGFRRAQLSAEDLAARIDAELKAAIALEDARAFADYSFLVVRADADGNSLRRSPLSAFPVESAIPGALGYFEVDPAGTLTTPLLPPADADPGDYGISADERRARLALEATIRKILVENRLVQRAARDESAAPAPRASDARSDLAPRAGAAGLVSGPVGAAPAAFDRLKTSARGGAPDQGAAAKASVRAEAPQRQGTSATRNGPPAPPAAAVPAPAAVSTPPRAGARQSRTEQTLVPEPRAAAETPSAAGRARLRIRAFESELEPFEIGLLDSGELVMYRNVWREGRRYIQGAVIDARRFIGGAVAAAFDASSLADSSDLAIAYGGKVLGTLRARGSSRGATPPLSGSLLYRERMSPPFGGLELIFSASRLPLAAGGALLGWIALVLAALLGGGFFVMHRFAIGQIRLVRQQQDFVSAVSHELKTPLTSIRMYGEMLKAGWVDEARRQTYYDYIHGESERLSRLIENVLELARLTRRDPRLDIRPVPVAELLDTLRSKVATQIERAGFVLDVRNAAGNGAEVPIDLDAFAQIVINLVDNAVKFAAGAERKVVELACRRERDERLLFTVRDFGPGIPKGQRRKVFELFYRPADELTRETAGTGIGLALVRQLTSAMGGRVEVRNCSPGAEFRLSFPSSAARSASQND